MSTPAHRSSVHLVVDAVVVRTGSVTIVLQHLVDAWAEAFPDDRISVLFGPEGQTFPLPPGAHAEILGPEGGGLANLWLRSVAVRRASARLGADVVLAGVPASGLLGTRARRGVILYDLRFELRPEQFSRGTRIARRISWTWSMRRATGIFCISDRTLDDLRERHPHLAGRAVTASLGADHVLAWPAGQPHDQPYALAFGHYGNKNADAVLAGWAEFCRTDDQWLLRLVGMSAQDRDAAQEQVRRLGIEDRVELMPWLDDETFEAWFVAAGLVIFPSDFEGFGLPAAEALRLGIPLVVSADPALAEVTGGHAVTIASLDPEDLAAACQKAVGRSQEEAAAGQEFASRFTWRHTAEVIRNRLR